MKKICVITTARSDYGCLKWLMKEFQKSLNYHLQIIVTGGHLLCEQGNTIDQIKADGFQIDRVVSFEYNRSDNHSLSKSMGKLAESISDAFSYLSPDLVLVLGDRYELLPICSTAFLMNIPIIHISGGDVTKGAIDDSVRNAVTMLATYHFPGTEDSAKNIIRMRGDENVWAVGEPGLDAFSYESLFSREELSENLGIDNNRKWALMTYHPETLINTDENINVLKNCLEQLDRLKEYQIVVTAANADIGGEEINQYVCEYVEAHKDFIYVPSLGHKRYLSFMKQVKFVIGNSSSGIIEAPLLHVPVINIGKRQLGRHMCDNIIQTTGECKAIMQAINTACEMQVKGIDSFYWGQGDTSKRIISILDKIEI